MKFKLNKLPILLYFCVLVLCSCTLFTSHYDAFRHKNYTNLKAYHLKFIEDNTEDEGNVWNENDIIEKCDIGELKFREAYEYALSKDKKDFTGSKAIKYLNEEFSENCKMLLKRKKLFNNSFVKGEYGILSEIKKQYGFAIAGEEYRVGKQ